MYRFSTQKIAYICFILLLLNLALSLIIFYTNDMPVEALDGSFIQPRSRELLVKLFAGQLFSFPLISLAIGAITALFIQRDQPYGKRYWKAYFLTLSSIYGALAIAGLVRSMMLIFS